MKWISTVRDDAVLSCCVQDKGSGPWVILQHALTTSALSYRDSGLAPALAEAGYRILMPDAVGHGRSSLVSDEKRFTLSERVKDVLAVADYVSASKFLFVGYSMGAWIGTGIVAEASERLTGCVFGGWDPINGAKSFTAFEDSPSRRAEFRETIKKLSSLTPNMRPPGRLQADGYVNAYEQLFVALPPLDHLRGRCPLSIIVGRDDPYAASAKRAGKILDADARVVPGDHLSAFWSPNFQDHVLSFARRLALIEA